MWWPHPLPLCPQTGDVPTGLKPAWEIYLNIISVHRDKIYCPNKTFFTSPQSVPNGWGKQGTQDRRELPVFLGRRIAFQTKQSQPILPFLIITFENSNYNNSILITHFILRIIIQNIFLEIHILFLHTAVVRVLPEPWDLHFICHLRRLMWVRHPSLPPSSVGESLWIEGLVFWQERQPVSRCHIDYGIMNFFFWPDLIDELLQWLKCHHFTQQNLFMSSVGLCNHRNVCIKTCINHFSCAPAGHSFHHILLKCKNKCRQFLNSGSCRIVFSKICMLVSFILMLEVYIKIIWIANPSYVSGTFERAAGTSDRATWLPGSPVLEDQFSE